jgi:hypothetical protein
MSSRLLVLGIAVLLIAVSAVAVVSATPLAPSLSGSHASPGTAVIPLTSISVQARNYANQTVSTFTPGQGTGSVYFAVHDPGHDDHVTVRIFDTNATRDGLTNPVATWTVNASSGSYFSNLHGLQYTLPTTLVYSGTWNVTASGTVGGNATTVFDVQTYNLVLLISPTTILGGHTGTVQFYAIGIPGGAPYTQISSVNLTAEYYDETTFSYAALPLSTASFGPGATHGSASFLLPINASDTGDLYVTGYANVTSAGSYSVESYQSANVGSFDFAYITAQCDCISSLVAPNSQVQLSVSAYLYTDGTTSLAPGVGVSFSFWSGSTPVPSGSIPGNPATRLTTNLNGAAVIAFFASPTVFSTTATDQVNISVVAVPSYNGSAPVYSNYTWDFLVAANGTGTATIVATFNQAQYYGGQTGTVAWSVLPANGGAASGWSGYAYEVSAYYGNSYNPLESGLLSGQSGTVTFTAPLNFTGDIYFSISAHNESVSISYQVGAVVAQASILVYANENRYMPGDTVQFTVDTAGPALATATLYYSVAVASDPAGAVLASGTLTGDTFSVTLPSPVAPSEILVTVSAQSPTLGVFASGSLNVYEAAGLTVNAGVSTISQYSDGSFQPSQTLTVTWNWVTYGPGQVPSSFWVELWNANGWWGDTGPLAQFPSNATSGSFQYTIPSGTPAGSQTLWVEVTANVPCVNYCYGVGQVSYQVNPSPSALNMELGAGSGLTVGWLILLLVIIIVAVILLVLVMRRRRAPPSPAATYTSTTTTMAPPAPAPSTPPAAEWKETPSPSDPPSLPPTGAQ